MLVEGRHFLRRRRSRTRSATRRWRSTCPTWRRWARRRAGRCSPARCPDDRPRVARGVRARLLRAGRCATASTSSAATPRAGRSTSASRSLGEVPAGTALTRAGARAGDDVYVSGHARRRGARARGAGRAHDARRRRRFAACRAAARAAGAARRAGAGAARRRDRRRSTSPTVSSAISATSSSVRASARAIDLARCPASPALAAMLDGRASARSALSCLLAGGDDYELCFTARRPQRERDRRDRGAASALPLTRIGTITAAGGLVVRDERGAPLPALPRAFDHFAGRERDGDDRSQRPRCASWSRHPAHFIALGFGSGLRAVRAGHVRHAGRDPARDRAARAYCGDAGFTRWRSSRCSSSASGRRRSPGATSASPTTASIVWDEVVAFLLGAVLRRRRLALRSPFAFLLFRFFDIVKPPPIRAARRGAEERLRRDARRPPRRRLHAARARGAAPGARRDAIAPAARRGARAPRSRRSGLNALQTQRQLFYDGWLLRVSPGKAKRARSVNAHLRLDAAAGRQDRLLRALYAQHGPAAAVPDHAVRPAGRARRRAGGARLRGVRRDAGAGGARSTGRRSCRRPAPTSTRRARPTSTRSSRPRASCADRRRCSAPRIASGCRIRRCRARCVVVRAGERIVCTATIALEDGFAGVFDVVTAADARGRGLRHACLRVAARLGLGARRARTPTCRSTPTTRRRSRCTASSASRPRTPTRIAGCRTRTDEPRRAVPGCESLPRGGSARPWPMGRDRDRDADIGGWPCAWARWPGNAAPSSPRRSPAPAASSPARSPTSPAARRGSTAASSPTRTTRRATCSASAPETLAAHGAVSEATARAMAAGALARSDADARGRGHRHRRPGRRHRRRSRWAPSASPGRRATARSRRRRCTSPATARRCARRASRRRSTDSSGASGGAEGGRRRVAAPGCRGGSAAVVRRRPAVRPSSSGGWHRTIVLCHNRSH